MIRTDLLPPGAARRPGHGRFRPVHGRVRLRRRPFGPAPADRGHLPGRHGRAFRRSASRQLPGRAVRSPSRLRRDRRALQLDSTFGCLLVPFTAPRPARPASPRAIAPDRARSHFEAQDVLRPALLGLRHQFPLAEPGAGRHRPDRRPAAISVGTTADPARSHPGGFLGPRRLCTSATPACPASWDLYAGDPPLGPALASGMATEAMAANAWGLGPAPTLASATAARGTPAAMDSGGPTNAQMDAGGAAYRPILRQGLPQARRLGQTLAGLMTQPHGPQVAAVSIDNFDTHANQGATQGQLALRLAYLDALLDGTSSGLGASWIDTVVLVCTEFGRTANNGTGGTDHGTARQPCCSAAPCAAAASSATGRPWPRTSCSKAATPPDHRHALLFKGAETASASTAALTPPSSPTAPTSPRPYLV